MSHGRQSAQQHGNATAFNPAPTDQIEYTLLSQIDRGSDDDDDDDDYCCVTKGQYKYGTLHIKFKATHLIIELTN